MTFPDVIIEYAPDDVPNAASPAWVDITDDWRVTVPAMVERGRQREMDRYSAGTCSVLLDNRTRGYDDQVNTDAVPMKRCRIRATYNSVTYPIFDGYVDEWRLEYPGTDDAVAALDATDGFKILAAAELASSAYAHEVVADSPVAWWRLDEGGGTVANDSVGTADLPATGTPTMGVASLISRDPGASATTNTSADGFYREGAALLSGGPLTVEMVVSTVAGTGTMFGMVSFHANRGFAFDGNEGIGFQVVTGSGAGANVTSSVAWDDGSPHHLAAVWNSDGTLKIYVDGVDRTVGTPSLAIGTFGFGSGWTMIGGSPFDAGMVGTYDEIAVYDHALTPTRIAAHAEARATPWNGDTPAERATRILDYIGWPAGLRDLDTNTGSLLQSAELDIGALTHLEKVAATEFGDLFISADGKVTLRARFAGQNATAAATFADDGTAGGYVTIDWDSSDRRIRNDIIVSRAEGVAQRVEDPTSIAQYLRHSHRIDGLLLAAAQPVGTGDETAREAANFLLSEYKDPKRRVQRLTIVPAGDPTVLFPAVLGLDLGDKVTVMFHPPGGGAAFEQTSRVEQIKHRFTTTQWETTLSLSPVFTGAVGIWDDTAATWDDARWGF